MDPTGAPRAAPPAVAGTPASQPTLPAVPTGGRLRQCAALSRTLAEPLAATAPPSGGCWLAVEHPGPWPRRAADADLPPAAAAVLRAAEALGIRVQLIRRPGRAGRTPARHTVLLASNRCPQPWLERAALDDLRALGEVDLAALAAGRRTGYGTPGGHPELLVCVHGRRDVCCARHGRPVAAATDAAHPGGAWETTHLGGDRFAANVACLPQGTYHGRVAEPTAGAVTAACLAGQVHLPHYRGRTGVPAPAQAAEHAVRAATGELRIAAVTVDRIEPHPGAHPDTQLVRLRVDGRPVAVPVRPVRPGPPRPTSCAGCTLDTPRYYVAGSPLAPESGPPRGG